MVALGSCIITEEESVTLHGLGPHLMSADGWALSTPGVRKPEGPGIDGIE